MISEGDGRPWGYLDRISARPGQHVAVHLSSPLSPVRVRIVREGSARRQVAAFDLDARAHPVPDRADERGCGWPAAGSFQIDAGWPSGYYAVEFETGAGTTRHMLCVRGADGRRARAALVLAVNTYQAYNWWGGRNLYLNVGAALAGASLTEASETCAHRLSWARPFAQGIVAAPEDAPRLVNPAPLPWGEPPAYGDLDWWLEQGYHPFDAAAGYTNKWEHAFVRWAEAEDIALDYLTDLDLAREPGVLDGHDVVFIVGHSEYWSLAQRQEVDRWTAAGGALAILSGNSCYWQVRPEDDAMVCYKAAAPTSDPVLADPARRHLMTGFWSHPIIGNPEAATTGLSFVLGGYHRMGLCAPRGAGGYTVYNDDHWLLEGTGLLYGDLFGSEANLVGYEVDGCALEFGDDGLPRPRPRLGVPANLEIVALCPASQMERQDRGIAADDLPLNAGEHADYARAYYGADAPADSGRMRRGHAVMAVFQKGRGFVFNAGTTEWARGLGDPAVQRITRNFLQRALRNRICE